MEKTTKLIVINEVISKFENRIKMFDKLLRSREYNHLAHVAEGDRFTRLQESWFRAYYKQKSYINGVISLLGIRKEYL